MTSGRYVLDASIFGPIILPDEASVHIEQMRDIVTTGDNIVPAHWSLEVANMGRMAVIRNRLTQPQLEQNLKAVSLFPIIIDADTASNAWGSTLALAVKHGLTLYDAAYLELAIRTERVLVSFDAALIAAATEENVKVITA